MKISCPNCNASGSIPEHEIPAEGRFLSCPRCKHGFTVTRPRAGGDDYLVDTCPVCAYSTFGEERFAACPKCGVIVKTAIERQREEQTRAREQELLTRKFSRDEVALPPEDYTSPVTAFVDNLHPVTLIGWGCALAAIIILGMGVWQLLQYNPGEIREQLVAQRDEQVSMWYVFAHYGLLPWIKTLYGGVALASSLFFIQQKEIALKLLSWTLRAALVFVPVYQVTEFVNWVLEPIPHVLLGYFVEIINILFVSALWGIPIFLLDRFLKDKRVTTVVRQ